MNTTPETRLAQRARAIGWLRGVDAAWLRLRGRPGIREQMTERGLLVPRHLADDTAHVDLRTFADELRAWADALVSHTDAERLTRAREIAGLSVRQLSSLVVGWLLAREEFTVAIHDDEAAVLWLIDRLERVQAHADVLTPDELVAVAGICKVRPEWMAAYPLLPPPDLEATLRGRQGITPDDRATLTEHMTAIGGFPASAGTPPASKVHVRTPPRRR